MPANPYDISDVYRRNQGGLGRAAGMAMQLMQMRNQFKMGSEKLELQKTGQKIDERGVAAREETNRLKGLELASEIPAHKKQFKPNMVLQKTAHFVNAFSKDVKPRMQKAISPVYESLKEFATMGESTNMDAARHFVKAWPSIKDDVEKNLESIIMDKSTDKLWMASEEGQRINELYNVVTTDQNGGQMVQALFGPTIQSFDQENRLAEAEITKSERTPEGKAVKAYVGPGGDIKYFRNNETPGAGYVPYSSGINVETTTPEGVTTRVSTGSRIKGPGTMEAGTKKMLEGKMFDASEAYQRQSEILSGFKPEYFEFETRLGMEWGSAKDKFKTLSKMFGSLDPETRSKVEEYSTYRKDALRMINEEIKRLTGAQMSEKEAKRIRGGMPDFGEGLIPPDSAGEFKSAVGDILIDLNAAAARYQIYLSQGFAPQQVDEMVSKDQGMSLTRVKEIMDEKESELVEYYKNQGMQVDEIADSVAVDLAGIFFGIGR